MRKAVSSVYGEIARMLLTFPRVKQADLVLTRYKGIFEALGKNITYVILAEPSAHDQLRTLAERSDLHPDQLELVDAVASPYVAVRTYFEPPLPGGNYLAEVDYDLHSIWAQDAYCVLQGERGPVMLEPLEFSRGGDHFIAEQIAAHTDIEVETTKYHIEGGNVLVGDNYALIGRDYLVKNRELTGESDEEITRGIRKVLGVSELVWVGSDEEINFPMHVYQGKHQPIFHIDMYITLAGRDDEDRELIFVGDTRSAKDLLGQEPVPEVISAAFDDVKASLDGTKLSGRTVRVERLPLDLWFNDPTGESATFLTYNNCLIETFGDARNVYVPAYASTAPASVNRRKLDESVKKLFVGERFNVTMMDGAYEQLCKRGGSLHCITKSLARG